MNKFFKKITFGLLLASGMIMLSGCSNSSNNNADHTFKVGMECAYAPFNWLQPSETNDAVKISGGWYACGYDVYMAKEIAQKLGKKLEIIKIDWDGLLPALSSGKIDAIIAGMSATPERKKTMDFTDNYYNSNVVIVVRKDSQYAGATGLSDFEGACLTGQLGTVHYGFIDQIKNVHKAVAMEDVSSMVSAVSSGKVDGYVSEKPAAMVVSQTNTSLTYIDFAPNSGFEFSQDDVAIAIGIKKGSSLRDDINGALEKISQKSRDDLMDKSVRASKIS